MESIVQCNIHGSCVTRDMIDYAWNKRIKLNQYVSRNSIFSVTQQPVPFSLAKKKLYDDHPWEKRMFLYDWNKEVKDSLSKPADFLLIDLMDERHKVFRISNENMSTMLTASVPFFHNKEIIDNILKEYETELIDTGTLSDSSIHEAVEKYVEWLLEYIPLNKIIVHEAYLTEEYINQNKQVKRFDSEIIETFIRCKNRKLRIMYQCLKAALSGCKVVKVSSKVFGDEHHKWGLAPMHYTEEYYKELYEQIIQLI